MKRLLFITLISILTIDSSLSAQTAQPDYYNMAREQYQKKNFEKAFEYYDNYYSNPDHGKSNYDTYYTAIAACQTGKAVEAKKYLNYALRIGFSTLDYDTFVNDSLNFCLRELPEWKRFIVNLKLKKDSTEAILRPIRKALYDTTLRVNNSLLNDTSYWNGIGSAKKLINAIRGFNNYPSPQKTGFWTLYTIKSDTLTVPFLLYIPKNYNSKQKTSLYVFLHGGVSGKRNFMLDPASTVDQQRNLFKKLYEQNVFVIYPFAKSNFNWLNHQAAFDAVVKEVVKVKSLYNIDDNKVYIGGHSDGGRGAFWFALNNPTTFAGFYAINYFPQLYTGNTSLRNLRNGQPFFGISGKEDSGMPLLYVNAIAAYSKQNGAKWNNYTVNGTHTLPYDMPDSVYFLFDTLSHQLRKPFPRKIEWETDNVNNGRCYWLEISKLDTLSEKATWQEELNPQVTKTDGKTGKINFNKNRSGAIIASIMDNIVNIQASKVKELVFYASPELVDLNKPVKIYVNEKLVFNTLIKKDKAVILDEFIKTKDRSLIVVNKIKIAL